MLQWNTVHSSGGGCKWKGDIKIASKKVMPAKNNCEELWKLEQRELSQPLRFIARTMLPTAALRLNDRHTLKGQREGENNSEINFGTRQY